MKKLICLLLLVLTVSGCGFSLHESYIRGKRPHSFKGYKVGPTSSLSDKDIREAIEFGKKIQT